MAVVLIVMSGVISSRSVGWSMCLLSVVSGTAKWILYYLFLSLYVDLFMPTCEVWNLMLSICFESYIIPYFFLLPAVWIANARRFIKGRQ